jgi:hypothetical protein
MDHDGKPVSPDQVPAEVRLYMAALEQHKDHAFVRGHFARITVMSVEYPSHGQVTFYVLEFRSGSNAALIWQDAQGNWGAGKWLRLSHPDADINCPPTPMSMQYFEGTKANSFLGGALDELTATKPAE